MNPLSKDEIQRVVTLVEGNYYVPYDLVRRYVLANLEAAQTMANHKAELKRQRQEFRVELDLAHQAQFHADRRWKMLKHRNKELSTQIEKAEARLDVPKKAKRLVLS